MAGNTVITIGRQYGSGGREIGMRLAKELGIKCYDKELLDQAAKDSGICEELFEHHDEKPTNSFLYSLVMDTYSFGYSSAAFADMPINHKVFLAQFDAIKNLAQKESCVMVGRCADYALSDYEGAFSVFIHADLDKRIRRIAKNMSSLTQQRRIVYAKQISKEQAIIIIIPARNGLKLLDIIYVWTAVSLALMDV